MYSKTCLEWGEVGFITVREQDPTYLIINLQEKASDVHEPLRFNYANDIMHLHVKGSYFCFRYEYGVLRMYSVLLRYYNALVFTLSFFFPF